MKMLSITDKNDGTKELLIEFNAWELPPESREEFLEGVWDAYIDRYGKKYIKPPSSDDIKNIMCKATFNPRRGGSVWIHECIATDKRWKVPVMLEVPAPEPDAKFKEEILNLVMKEYIKKGVH